MAEDQTETDRLLAPPDSGTVSGDQGINIPMGDLGGGQNDEGQNDGGQNDGGQNDGGQNDGGQNDGGQNDGGQNDIGQNGGDQNSRGQNGGGQNGGDQNSRGQNGGGQNDGGRGKREENNQHTSDTAPRGRVNNGGRGENCVANIMMRVCSNFSENQSQVGKCFCNYTKVDHSNDAQNNVVPINERWSFANHTKMIPTNAFGEVKFAEDASVAKYVRLAYDTPNEKMTELLFSHWEMEKTDLLLSVTGTVTNTLRYGNLADSFSDGLVEAATSSGAWIVTDGDRTDLSKKVVQTLKKYKEQGRTIEKEVKTIGITGWGPLGHKQCLINEEDHNGPVEYPESENENQFSYLEPSHTHYILVDNGTQNYFGVEIPFRAKFEDEIGKQESGTRFSNCLLVFGGDLHSLYTVYMALQRGTPTVVIKGSGGTADILDHAYQNVTIIPDGIKFEKGALDKMKERMEETFGEYKEEYLQTILECVTRTDILSVYELDFKDSSKDLEVAILTTLLKTKKHNLLKTKEHRLVENLKHELAHQLKLAVMWNKIDAARDGICCDEVTWTAEHLHDVMILAIKSDRGDFVKLFYETGMHNFLKVQDLLDLYASIPKSCFLNQQMCEILGLEDIKNITLSNICEVTNAFAKKPYNHIITVSSNDIIPSTRDIHELFVWATLMNYHDLGKVFWTMSGEFAIPEALLAQNILMSVKERAKDQLSAPEIQKSIDDYEKLAVDLVDKCYASEDNETRNLLIRNIKSWGNISCINLALKAKNKLFLSHKSCQKRFFTALYGHIQTDVSLLLVALFTFPFLVPFAPLLPFIRLNSKKQSCCQKLCDFFHSPIVKYCLSAHSYLAFLALYGYILLVRFNDDFHWLEGILIAWVASILVDEIRQLTSKNVQNKFDIMTYLSSFWNKLDISNISLFFIGYFSKFGSMDAARVILSMNFITFCLRFLQFFIVNKQVGSLILMIVKMIKDTFTMFIILTVFIVSYAVASESLLYPEAKPSWELFPNIIRKAYWNIFGELFLEDIEGDADCTTDPALYNNGTMLRCPSDVGQAAVPIFLGVYVLATHVMLLNILIALLTSNYNKYREVVDISWKWQLFHISQEYTECSAVPHPFSIFHNIYKILQLCNCCCPSDGRGNQFCKNLLDREEKSVTKWARTIAHIYFANLDKGKSKIAQSEMEFVVEKKMRSFTEKLEQLYLIVAQNKSQYMEKPDIMGNKEIPTMTTRNSAEFEEDDELSGGVLEVRVKQCSEHFYQIHAKDSYPMGRKPRGMALIINVYDVEEQRPREGTNVDRDNLRSLFSELFFEVTVYNDDDGLSAREIIDKTRRFAADHRHANMDACIVCFLSHGTEGCIFGTDGREVNLGFIFDMFNSMECEHLQGKPKIFITQACRGNMMEVRRPNLAMRGISSDAAADPLFDDIGYAERADMLICYPTQAFKVAYRNTRTGSWYIEALVKIFMEYAHREDVLTMLNRVNEVVSKKAGRLRESYQNYVIMRQMSEYQSTLTKPHLYFFPGIESSGDS